MSVEAVSGAFGEDGQWLAADGPALDLIVAELKPRAVSLLVVGPDGSVHCRDARAATLVGDARREVDNWHRQVGSRTPLAAEAVDGFHRPLVTFAEIGHEPSILLDDSALLTAYRQIGAIDDVRLLIRDGRRLVAMIAVWRPLQSLPWTEEARRRLEALHPLIAMAWLAAPSPPPVVERLPDADLTPRQREVAALLAAGATNPEMARALGISRNTVKTHARAVLAKLGAGSRQELLLALRSPSAPS